MFPLVSQVLVFEKPVDLATASRFEVAASDVVVVTTNVLTKEFSRCFIDPLDAPNKQKEQHQQQRQRSVLVSGAEAENRFWHRFIVKTGGDIAEGMQEATILRRFASVMPAEQRHHLVSTLKRRTRQSQSIHLTSASPGGFYRLLCARSPLLGVHFARVAVDEGHRLVQSGSLHVQLACAVRADKR